MSQNSYSFVLRILSIILAGVSIKLLDNAVDDGSIKYAPYAICLSCISVLLWRVSLSLVLCSYVVGMFHDESLKLISGLRVYQEQVILLIVCILAIGLTDTVSSLLIICIIQLMDDLIDEKIDRNEGKKNWAAVLGRIEVTIIVVIFLVLSIYIDLLKTLLCVISALLISWIFNRVINNLRVVP